MDCSGVDQGRVLKKITPKQRLKAIAEVKLWMDGGAQFLYTFDWFTECLGVDGDYFRKKFLGQLSNWLNEVKKC
jgi:hypothetical protein